MESLLGNTVIKKKVMKLKNIEALEPNNRLPGRH
jgi:hypothetical protein